jgi:Na+-transporting methylmalonyl-CoA/oxaloacetate decarboxylase gamma subunit
MPFSASDIESYGISAKKEGHDASGLISSDAHDVSASGIRAATDRAIGSGIQSVDQTSRAARQVTRTGDNALSLFKRRGVIRRGGEAVEGVASSASPTTATGIAGGLAKKAGGIASGIGTTLASPFSSTLDDAEADDDTGGIEGMRSMSKAASSGLRTGGRFAKKAVSSVGKAAAATGSDAAAGTAWSGGVGAGVAGSESAAAGSSVAAGGAAASGGAASGGAAAGGGVAASGAGTTAALGSNPIGLIVVGVLFVLLIVVFLIVIVVCASTAAEQSTGSLTGSLQEIAQYLKEHDVDDLHIAAILGNMQQESGGMPDFNAIEGVGYDDGGHGICQWTDGAPGSGRWQELQDYANSCRLPWTDHTVQLDFLWAELSGQGPASSYAAIELDWNGFLAITDLTQATDYFCDQFERPNANLANKPQREQYAEDDYMKLTSGGSIIAGSDTMQTVVDTAQSKIGDPYVWGATGPDSFDCSGLVYYCYQQAGITLTGRTTYVYWTYPTDPTPQVGDICTSYEHCGIYIGNGQMIHAPEPGENVKIGPVQAGMKIVIPQAQ